MIDKIKTILKSGNNKRLLGLLLVVFFLIFVPVHYVRAEWITNQLMMGISWIVYGVVYAIGSLITFLIGYLVAVASFSDFINVPAVTTGWTLVRDLANMFFILILLVIAFGTILRVESYSAKKLLPNLLMMAVLINFSRTICGLIIDFSQVIMLTFVNSFAGSGGANNFTTLLGMDKMMQVAKNQAVETGTLQFTTFAGIFLGLLFSLVTLVVIITMVALLVARVVMLWIYVILSPLAYLLSSFPQGKSHASTWWKDFSSYVISGPVLAFFLWLALATASGSASLLVKEGSITTPGVTGDMITGFLNNGVFTTYLITIGLLIGGLMVTQKVSGSLGSIAGKGMSALQKGKGLALGKASKELQYFSGISAARQYLKQRAEVKETIRQSKISDQAAKIGAMVDVSRQFTTGFVAKGAKNVWSRITGENMIKKLKDENVLARTRLSQIKNNEGPAYDDIKTLIQRRIEKLNQGNDLDVGGVKYKKLSADNSSWEAPSGIKLTKDQITKIAAEEHAQKTASTIEVNIKQKEESIAKLEEKKKSINNFAKLGLAVGAGGLTGGLGGILALGGYGLARGGVSWAGKRAIGMAKEDTIDGKYVAKYKSEKVNKEIENLKDTSSKDVRAILSDGSKTTFERMAALMEGMNRKIFSEEEVRKHKDTILKEIGGKEGEYSFVNKKINSKFESVATKNGYLSSTNLFDKGLPKDSKGNIDKTSNEYNSNEARNARFEIEKGIAEGSYKMSDLGAETLKQFVEKFAQKNTVPSFKNEYDKMGASMQKIVIDGLRASSDENAKVKLALLKDFGQLSSPEEKDVVLSKLTLSQIRDIFNSGDRNKVEEFKIAVDGDVTKMAPVVQDHINGKSPAGKDLRRMMGIEEKESEEDKEKTS